MLVSFPFSEEVFGCDSDMLVTIEGNTWDGRSFEALQRMTVSECDGSCHP